MSSWCVTLLVEMIYRVEADSSEEAEEKVQEGTFDEEEYGGVHVVMSVEEV